MSSAIILNVLTPNGRRQNVKATPNTTILQVLEEVCQKQGFKPEEYDLKHHNHVLDVSSIIRFSGLPNNAQLEMCAIQKAREESPVILGIQLEHGTRLTGNYLPSDNLWHILTSLCPDEVKEQQYLVIIYMRQEIYGVDALQNTTLKSLGLTGGRAMLRLIHRQPEQLHTQANVSAPLPYKPPEEKPYIRKFQPVEEPPKPKQEETKKIEYHPEPSPSPPKDTKNLITELIKKEKSAKRQKSSGPKGTERMEIESPASPKKRDVLDEEFVFLGERNALAFSLDMASTVPHEDLPDEFFELTLHDARKLLNDLKQKRVEIEESPLQTKELRNLERDKKVLRQLGQYKKCVIRIQFPDRTVLQGTFKPVETVEIVQDFVMEYLQEPRKPFHLYMTPPKTILNKNATLLEAECVPSAVIHFAFDTPEKEGYKYLRDNLFTKFTSHSLASLAAAKTRGNETNRLETNEDSTNDIEMHFEEVNAGASTSYATQAYQPVARPSEKLPKWFKSSK